MNWIELKSLEQLDEIAHSSNESPVLIFKHSTRCGTSRLAFDRLNRNGGNDFSEMKKFFLDLITYRDISNAIVQKFDVEHESPQAIVVRNGKAVFSASHFEIDYHVLKDQLRYLH